MLLDINGKLLWEEETHVHYSQEFQCGMPIMTIFQTFLIGHQFHLVDGLNQILNNTKEILHYVMPQLI
jgi:hypothetical protein